MTDLTDKLADALEKVLSSAHPNPMDNPLMAAAWKTGRDTLIAYRAQRDGEKDLELEPSPVRECYSNSGYHEWVTSWTGGTRRCRQCQVLDRGPLTKGEA